MLKFLMADLKGVTMYTPRKMIGRPLLKFAAFLEKVARKKSVVE